MIFISSWDDGHPCDVRLADLLARHGLKGTFYVPMRNREGRDVMAVQQVRELDSAFELGSHTRDHSYLTALSEAERMLQIREGKQELEDILGHYVAGFCYPGGKLNRHVRQSVIDAGFLHARTVNNLWLTSGKDVFSIPTTAQFYQHRPSVLWRNFLKGGHYLERVSAMRTLMLGDDRFEALHELANRYMDSDRIFHVWGHSWEIDKFDLWRQLDTFLSHIVSLGPKCMTVSELVESQWPAS
jgi:peptidoglycan/xylan/chitin deacetylase (PgdA/CDA1 family)